MIDRDQPQLVDIVDLFHRLHEAHAQLAVHRRQRASVNLDPLAGVGRIASRGRKPVAHHRRANHIRHQLVFMPIPCKQHRTRTAPPVGLLHRNHRRMRQINFVLQHARRPQNAQQVNPLRIAQPHKNLRRNLRLIAHRSGQLPLLPKPVGEDFHLRANRRLVIGKAGQIETHKMILVRAHIAQQHRRRIQLRHNQIRRAVARHIGGNQSARRVQHHAVQAQRVAHIFKAAVSAIAEDAHPRPRFRFHNCRQINPAVVVDVDGRNAPSPQSAMQREFHSFKPPANVFRSSNIAPQRQSRRTRMGHGNIHPAVFDVVQHGNTLGRRQLLIFIKSLCRIFPFSRIHINQRRCSIAGYCQVHGAVVVEVGKNRGSRPSASAQPRRLCLLAKCSVAVVAPQDV